MECHIEGQRSLSSTLRSISKTLQLVLDNECVLENGSWIFSKECEGTLLVVLSKIQKCFSLDDTTTLDLVRKRKQSVGEFESEDGSLRSFERNVQFENLQEVVNILMILSVLENDFIGHSSGRILLALSQFLCKTTSALAPFLHILWNASKIWCTDSINNVTVNVTNASESDAQAKFPQAALSAKTPDVHNPGCEFSMPSFGKLAFPTLKRNWATAARGILLLRRILKICNHENSSNFEVFFDVAQCHVRDIFSIFMEYVSPSTHVKKTCCNEETTGGISSSANMSPDKSKQMFEKELFVGSWIQLLCSMFHSLIWGVDTLEDKKSLFSLLKHVESFLPALAAFSLVPHHHLICDSCISTFLRHKYMVMLSRLSSWFTEQPSLAIVCLETLQVYAGDLLHNVLFQDRPQSDSLLLDSPFVSSLVQTKILDQPGSFSKYHLQRHAVFLVFKAVISLRKGTNESKKSCGEAASTQDVSRMKEHDINETEKCSEAEKWLVNWLLMHVESLSDTSSCEICHIANGLASSFLQLFVHDDDLMLHVLLELFDLPLSSVFAMNYDLNVKSSRKAQTLLVMALSPLRLFSAFLSVVQYDYTVIIDYLISNSTGTLCLQYLLRCLQVICGTWPDFLHVSSIEYHQNSRKRATSLQPLTEACGRCCPKKSKKVLPQPQICSCQCCKNCLGFQEIDRSTNTSPDENTGGLLLGIQLETNSEDKLVKAGGLKRRYHLFYKDFNEKKGANCLISLQIAIERMQQRSLFPYNASPLLKHLQFFQQLWQRQMRIS